MVRKRIRDPEPAAPPAQSIDQDGDSDGDVDMVDVEFEWFNFKPDIDFHGVKSLIRQLLDVDSQLFDVSAVSDLVLSQPTIGSTVKVDGEETDPYAFLTILNLREHKDKPVVQDISKYILQKAQSEPALKIVADLLQSSAEVGLILAERLINAPAEIAPPMYGMLIDEVEAAVEDKEPYEFTHYLILSKTYHEIVSTLDQEEAPKSKKNKAGKGSKEIFYFHPEDEVLQKHAVAFGSYDYTKDEGDGMADSKRAFSEMGIKPQGSMILIEAAKFEGAFKAISEYLSPPQ